MPLQIKWKLIILLSFNLLWGFSQENNYRFNQISIENGLSNNSVTCIYKDSRGYIWIGTTDGLNRYNGYNFIVYKHDPSDPNSISDDFISTIIEDHSGNIWIGTQGGGLNMYNYLYDRFTRYYHDPNNPNSISSNFIFHHNSLLLDEDTLLWIGTDNGLCRFDIKNGVFDSPKLNIKTINGNEIKDTRVIFKNDDHVLWIGTDAGLLRYTKATGETKLFEQQPGVPGSISNNIITSISSYSATENLWIGTEDGLNLFNKKKETFTRFYNIAGDYNTLSDNSITSVVEDFTGNYWIGTKSGGLNKYNPATKGFNFWKYDPANNYGISDNYVDYLYYDNEGILWIGSINAGINLLNIEDNKFTIIRNDPKNPNSLSYNTIRSIYEDYQGILWIGTYGGGLNRYDGRNFTHYLHEPDNPASISHNIVSAIHEDKYGNFWIGTWGGSLSLMNRKTGEFSQNSYNIPEFVNDIYEDNSGNLWIGCNGGVFVYNQEKKNVFRFDSEVSGHSKLTATSINKILKDRFGYIWVGTWNGLNRVRYNAETFAIDTIYRYRKESSQNNNLSDNRIITAYEDSRGNLWIGTYAGGLNKINLYSLHSTKTPDPEFVNFTDKDGLPGNTVYGILEDNTGNLWISTNNGLSKFNVENQEFYNFYEDDGLQGNQFYWHAFLKARSGEMYFGGINGLNFFHPDSIKSKQDFPKVVISDFLLFNKSVGIAKETNGRQILEKSISFTDNIILTRKDYAFSFEFSALTYKSQNKIRYAYQLENFDPEWIYTSAKRRYATYSHLRPGNYTFKVKSTSRNGAWDNNFTKIDITILPAYWETTWAFIIYGIVLVLLLIFFRSQILARARYKHNIQLERIEHEKAEEYNDMKLKFFTNISHEFKTPLTLILGPLDKLLLMNNLDHKIKQQLTFMHSGSKRLLRLINQVLKFRKVETGNFELRVSQQDIIPYLKEIAVSFKSQSRRNHIKYSLKFPATSAYVWFDENIIETIVYNLLSNAFKFTPEKGKIQLAVSFTDSENKIVIPDREHERNICIEVSDTGSGISQERLELIFKRFYQIGKSEEQKRGTGIGLALCKDLVELHHGTISVQSEEHVGTKFTVIIPVYESFFTESEFDRSIPDATSVRKNLPEFLKEEQEIVLNDEDISALHFNKPDQANAPKILIIEDDAELVKYVGKLLENNYFIITANNGIKGLECALKENPDLIISDIMMPEENGIDLCEKLKTDFHTSHIPIILLTALSSIDDKIKGISVGADEYISKPFHPKHLTIRIEKLIEQHRQLKKYFTSAGFYNNPDRSDIPSIDEKFLKKVMDYIEKNISESELNVDHLSKEIGISSTHLYRKIKTLTGLSTNELIRKLRLKKAAGLLSSGQGTISQVMYDVGFSSHSYFAKCFQEEFGLTPKEFISVKVRK
ncbi:MAG: response regulator [Bacteroidales bacterium]|nr:response regulator [Bacteroidales bacterium]